MAPPPTLTISQWSDQRRYLSTESSAEPGRWRTDRVPYMREIMDALNDPGIERIIVPKAAQVAYTESVNNVVGYFIDQDPAPLLLIMPTLELAEAHSKDRLAPMLRDTPALAGKVHDPKSRDSGNTIRSKIFPGGRLTLIGANAPAGLSARPIRIVLGDEVDRWPLSAGGSSDNDTKRGEGDPLTLAAKRQTTFWNRKTLIGSTPVHKLTSVIWREYEASDRRRYFVPCPACDHMQTLRWEQVRWDKRGKNEKPDPVHGEHKPETAHYVCEHCGAIWGDGERHDAVRHGEWRAENPGGTTAGFHVPGFLSPWLSLEQIVREFLAARRDPQLLQVWVNTVLGEPWEEQGESVEGTGLLKRGENYTPQTLPPGIVLLTAGIDVQVNRVEIQVVGWGVHEESWAIAYAIVYGDPEQATLWDEVDELLLDSFANERGQELRIRACCIDVGDSPHANAATAFCKKRFARRIYPTKGIAGPRPVWPLRSSRTKTNEQIFLIGVDTGKDAIYGRLRISKPGPGFVHFPAGQSFDENYFAQLTAEQVVTRKREGRPYRVWVLPSGKRNEALDTFVLALAARSSLRVRIEPRAEPSAAAPPSVPMPLEGGPDLAQPQTAPPLEQPTAPAAPAPRHSLMDQPQWIARRQRGWWNR